MLQGSLLRLLSAAPLVLRLPGCPPSSDPPGGCLRAAGQAATQQQGRSERCRPAGAAAPTGGPRMGGLLMGRLLVFRLRDCNGRQAHPTSQLGARPCRHLAGGTALACWEV